LPIDPAKQPAGDQLPDVYFRCERWRTACGKTITAPLPAGIQWHFGPQLRRFVLMQYHQGQATVP